MTKEKTILEWLEELPDGYRELALRSYDPEFCDTGVNIIDLADALVWGFSWEDTPEGQVFWDAVWGWAIGKGELPPLPKETGWIRVEDGLPTHSNEVLLTDGRWRTVGVNNGDCWMVYEDEPMNMEHSTFTHWMEYPELPEEE